MAEREVIHFPMWAQLAPHPFFLAPVPAEPVREFSPVVAPRQMAVPHRCAQTSCSLYGGNLPKAIVRVHAEAER
jgi:hypothetical protein